ncbi:MAG: glutaredoxin [Erysipelotrichia bacterium]|nr:glutaredoxin [Erysipelotrichia bacterium]
MKKILWFYMNGCPYCVKGERAYEELKQEHPEYASIKYDYIEENEHPEISSKYDYQANPALYIDDQLMFQAHFGQSYSDIKAGIKSVLDAALKD